MNKILSINKIKKYYHDLDTEIEAIKDITLDIYENEIVSIVGPSGCGKSTFLSIIAGIQNKSEGMINFKKEKVKIGYMLQKDSLFPWRTILDNCLIGLEIEKKCTKENREKVISLLKKYGLGDFINKYPDSLSGGMRQRVSLIRTLAIDPDILLLDEPLSALDYQTRLALSDDIYNIIKNENKTAIMVTHDLGEAVSISDRVIVLSKRPTTVKKIYNIEYEKRENPIKNRNKEEFRYYYNAIWSDLDVHV